MRRLNVLELSDLFIAAKELALARHFLLTMTPSELLAIAYRQEQHKSVSSATADADVRRVVIAVGRMSSRVPWRASCLVQALAARRWLARRGIPTSLFFGVRKASQALEAHAWLVRGSDVIIGGDIAAYQKLLSQEVMDKLKQIEMGSAETHARTAG